MTFWLSRGRKTRRRTSGNEVSDDPFSCSLLVVLSNGLSSKIPRLGIWVLFGSSTHEEGSCQGSQISNNSSNGRSDSTGGVCKNFREVQASMPVSLPANPSMIFFSFLFKE